MHFRDLGAQYRYLKKDIDSALLRVASSAQYIGGVEVQTLEKELAEYVGVEHCISCGNGTDALQLGLMAWGVGPGDAVIVPDFTFFSSGEVVSAVGATPIFVDVVEETFNLDPSQIEPAVNKAKEAGLNPRVVIAVDLFGQPADYSAIRKECDRFNMLLLEDGAQGFGGSIGNQKACSFGDISTTSFFPAKPLGCYGDGGAIFTDNDEWAALIRSFAVHGKGSMKYDNVRIGMNSRLDTIQAAVLLVKFNAFKNHEINDVNRIALEYEKLLSESKFVLPVVKDGYTSSWAQYTIQVPVGVNRSILQDRLKASGIPTMIYYPKPMHEQGAFKSNSICVNGCPVTTRLTSNVLSLPMGPYLSFEDVRDVCYALKTRKLK